MAKRKMEFKEEEKAKLRDKIYQEGEFNPESDVRAAHVFTEQEVLNMSEIIQNASKIYN